MINNKNEIPAHLFKQSIVAAQYKSKPPSEMPLSHFADLIRFATKRFERNDRTSATSILYPHPTLPLNLYFIVQDLHSFYAPRPQGTEKSIRQMKLNKLLPSIKNFSKQTDYDIHIKTVFHLTDEESLMQTAERMLAIDDDAIAYFKWM